MKDGPTGLIILPGFFIMGFPLEKTPWSVSIRLLRDGGSFSVLRRDGLCWFRMRSFGDEREALAFLDEQIQFQKRLADWSEQVKIKAGYVCQECGELDIALLESHHIKAKSLFPSLIVDIENGRCLCLWDHAEKHRDKPRVAEKILARLGMILYERLYPGRTRGCLTNGRLRLRQGRRSGRRKQTKELIKSLPAHAGQS